MGVKFKSKAKETISAFEKGVQRGLESIGMDAERNAKKIITQANAIDTGRLRNSITWATKEQEGEFKEYKDDNGQKYSQRVGFGAEKKSVYIGTNVEYAEGIELGTHRRAGAVHFLQGAAQNYGSKYKKIMQASIEAEKEP